MNIIYFFSTCLILLIIVSILIGLLPSISDAHAAANEPIIGISLDNLKLLMIRMSELIKHHRFLLYQQYFPRKHLLKKETFLFFVSTQKTPLLPSLRIKFLNLVLS